ncbi:MAG: DUF4373 domain-containing protein [Bacteroidales bacterium]|nr:DUF4373 domain-containing protein [Bacteroidales bacterium]
MSKNKTTYFSHDCNARSDEKLLAVRMRHKAEGYGVFFMLVEMMAEEPSHTLLKDYNLIAFELRVGSDIVRSIVEDFGLFQFTEDGERFYSESLIERMAGIDDLRQKRSDAAKKRWSKMQNYANASESECKTMQMHQEIDANKIKGNKNKNKKNSKEQKKESEPMQEQESALPDYMLVETPKLYEELRAELSAETQNAANAMRLLKLPREQILSLLDDFQAKIALEGQMLEKRSDYRRHFSNWAAIQAQKMQTKKTQTQSQSQIHVSNTNTDYYTDF